MFRPLHRGLGEAEAPRAVRSDPLVHGNRDELDVAAGAQDFVAEDGHDADVLAPGEADGDSFPAREVHLGAQLVLHPALDERQEVIAAEVLPAVANQSDGGRLALRAGHARRDGGYG